MNVELCEVMYFDTVLTNTQVEQVELYLKDKWRYDEWASPVPTPTPTSSNTPTPTPSLTPTQTLTQTPSPSAPSFNPSSLSPNIWVDFNDGSTITFRSGTNYISNITNKGTNATLTAFTQSTAANQPLLINNSTAFTTSVSAATFSNDLLKSNVDFSSSTFNCFAVFGGIPPADATSMTPIYKYGTSSSQIIQFGVNRGGFTTPSATHAIQGMSNGTGSFINYGYSGITYPQSGQTNQWYWSFTGSSGVSNYVINNTSGTTPFLINSSSGAFGDYKNIIGSGRINLLNSDGSSTDYTGQLGEVLIFTRELTTTETNNLNAYLKSKWGLIY
jgi:hypothetical protein